jgi:four helix bundle protein
MAFHTLEVALDLIHALRTPVASIQRADKSLADQIRRAASSIALNVSEARRRDGKDREYLFRVASGSAAETKTGIEVAQAWGYVGVESVAPALVLLDRLLALLWRLTHR